MARIFTFLFALMIVLLFFWGCETTDKDEGPSSDSGGSGNDDSTGDFGQWDNDDDNDDSGVDDDSHDDDDSGTEDDDDDNVTDCQLTEGFEAPVFPPSGWTVDETNPIGQLQWYRWQYIPYSGNYSAYIYSFEYLWIFDSDELLYTSQIDLSNYVSSEVTFWNFAVYGFYYGSFTPPTLTVEVSYDAISWTPIWNYALPNWADLNDYYNNWDVLYQQETLDLTDFLGESIYLGWRLFLSPSGDQGLYVWFLDDIKVCGMQVK